MTTTDFMAADKQDILAIMNKISIVNDITSYKHWLESSGESLDIPLQIGSRRSLCVHPSTICKAGVCPLKVYYECTGELDKNKCHPLDLHNTFDTGTALHAVLQAYCEAVFNDSNIKQFEREVKLVNKELHMNGHADGVFTFTDHRFILEIKTIKEGGNVGWEKVQTRPLPDNERQLRIYMHLANIPFGLLYYWCKNNGSVKEHVVTYDGGAVWDEVAAMVKPVVDAAYNKGPPVKGIVGAMCRMCDFNYGCSDYRRQHETTVGTRTLRTPIQYRGSGN
jgi:CRISPR/Cas system-associated exonuclease Cas4 (RecB family)